MQSDRLDFDSLSLLAHSDPRGFERLRLDAIEAVISRAPPERQPRLRSLQWRIDREREKSATPLSACIRISGLMWERVVGADGLVDNLERLRACLVAGSPARTQRRPARILPFEPLC